MDLGRPLARRGAFTCKANWARYYRRGPEPPIGGAKMQYDVKLNQPGLEEVNGPVTKSQQDLRVRYQAELSRRPPEREYVACRKDSRITRLHRRLRYHL